MGAGAALFIGASAHFVPAPNPPPLTQADPPAEAALPDELSPGLSEIIKLAQAHVDEGVILVYIKNSGQVFSPTAEEILYLSDLGLSQGVINALFKPAPPPGAPVPAEPPPVVIQPGQTSGESAFYNEPAPNGAWQPAAQTIDPDWRPYVDSGQWLNSEAPLPLISGAAFVQLPRLRYPAPHNSPAVHRHHGEFNVASAPRLEPYNPPVRHAEPSARPPEPLPRHAEPSVRPPEPPRLATESRPAPVEPPRAAPAPLATSPPGGVKSGK